MSLRALTTPGFVVDFENPDALLVVLSCCPPPPPTHTHTVLFSSAKLLDFAAQKRRGKKWTKILVERRLLRLRNFDRTESGALAAGTFQCLFTKQRNGWSFTFTRNDAFDARALNINKTVHLPMGNGRLLASGPAGNGAFATDPFAHGAACNPQQ